jgi:DNA-directed RNA polymerase specialized sigma24 family protein
MHEREQRVRVIVMMYQHELSDREGYELFRRAIVERSDDAWSQIYTYFRPLLLAWSRQCRARSPSAEPPEDLADRALARAWAALSPDRFEQFSGLPALLGYLRTCVGATAIDSSRVEVTRERAYQKLEPRSVATPEQIVVEESARATLWRLVAALVGSEQERIVVDESFVLALPPRQILERHPDDFATIGDVYGAKRNVLNRLMRCRELHKLCEEWLG